MSKKIKPDGAPDIDPDPEGLVAFEAPKAPETFTVSKPEPPKPEPRQVPEKRQYRVVARHTPCVVKNLTVEAASEDEAFAKFCEANKLKAQEILRRNKKSSAPEGVGTFLQMRSLYPDVSVAAV